MSTHARDALRLLVAAMESHLDAVATRRGPVDAAVEDAYDAVAEAFEAYEEALDIEFAEALPLVLDEEGDFDDDESSATDEDDAEVDEAAEDGVVGDDDADGDVDEEIDPHAEEDEDDLDDDLVEFDLR